MVFFKGSLLVGYVVNWNDYWMLCLYLFYIFFFFWILFIFMFEFIYVCKGVGYLLGVVCCCFVFE